VGPNGPKTASTPLPTSTASPATSLPGAQVIHDYEDDARNISASTATNAIDVVPLTASDYPPATFDSASFTTGPRWKATE